MTKEELIKILSELSTEEVVQIFEKNCHFCNGTKICSYFRDGKCVCRTGKEPSEIALYLKNLSESVCEDTVSDHCNYYHE